MEKYGEVEWGWVPRRIPGYRVSALWARLFRRVVNKEVSVQNSYMGKGGFVSWDVSVRGGLRQSEKFESYF